MKNVGRPTIKDVARLARVSTTTVSQVLVIKELDYKPDNRARSLRSARRGIIGLIVPNTLNPFCAQLAVVVENAAYHRGYGLIFFHAQYDGSSKLGLW